MKTYKIWNNSASDTQLEEISKHLLTGEIMVFPTDTLYTIGCDALNAKAIERVCKIKGLNPDKSRLSIICSSISQASEYTKIDNKSFRLIKDNTPGAFTFILQASSRLPKTLKNRKTIGIRIPECKFDLEIANHINRPILTTSITYSDPDEAIVPSLIEERYRSLIDIMIIGDDGSTEQSTIVDCSNNSFEVLREGKGELV